MWQVTPQNAPMVIVVTSAAMACVAGATTAHILTKRALKAKYEALAEEEVQKAKLYFADRSKVGAYNDPETVESEPEIAHQRDYVEKVEPYRTGRRDIPKATSKPKPDEDMEAFELRLIREAKEEVETIKRELDISDEDEEESEVITMNVFSENEAAASDDRDTSKPYIISVREFEDGEEDYSQNSLTYYEGDDVLTDERDQPIQHIVKIVGDNLRFGEMSEDPNVVYIRNHELEVDFEICRSAGTYTEEVLGYTDPSNKQRPRRFREYD